MPSGLVPKPSSPPYVPMTTSDVWGQVKKRWEDMYSPAEACPLSEYGPADSPGYAECVRVHALAWSQIKDKLPDTPVVGPYNNLVDLVSVEDICYTASYPEDASFPNLIEDAGALATRLQESWKRSVAPQYCQNGGDEFPPTEGGCFCMPYMVVLSFELEQTGAPGIWGVPIQTQAPVWGPVSGIGVKNFPAGTNASVPSWEVYINCQGPDFFSGNAWLCTRDRIESNVAGGDNAQVRLSGVGSIRPLTAAECLTFLGSVIPGYPDPTGECPLPLAPYPPPPHPNTACYQVPNSPPAIAFPVTGPSCPVETDMLRIEVVYVDGQGIQGPPGPPGEPGEGGTSTMRRAIRERSESELDSASARVGGDLTVDLPRGCAFVRIDWVAVLADPKPEFLRQFHDSPNDESLDEFQLGRVYLSISGQDGWFGAYLQASKGQTLVTIPDVPGVRYSVSVTDVYGVGIRIVDIGYRYKEFKWANPEDIPSIDYTSQS